ncbi:hypothetical protein D0Z00_003565 [Geotrichum galactomycetum]|uniref:Uncharacterized protein n=1 Tax=Geotrichum galactomycetum TaxID=27317 RepID=A0ACB6V0X4_9ASCO|nr:hypothetical protein D0Z00_003565 [Geotrichum candidum]
MKVNQAFCMPVNEQTPPLYEQPKTKAHLQPLFSAPTVYEALESQQVELEYRDDIIKHLSNLEELTRSDPELMDMQPELQWQMRPYLLDFLVESHLGLQLSQETLFLAVNIVDRYSSKRVVFRRHYQLVGCSALWIASKYQDKKNKVPTLEELKIICCKMYEPHMFVQMELHILSTLDWSVGHPTFDVYIDLCFGTIQQQDRECASNVRNIALYLCENSMYSKELVPLLPSVVAKAAFKLGLYFLTLGRIPCKAADEEEAYCLNIMSRYCFQPTVCLERKYSRPEYSSAMQYIQEFADYHQQLQQQKHYQSSTSSMHTPTKPTSTAFPTQLATPAPTPTRSLSESESYKASKAATAAKSSALKKNSSFEDKPNKKKAKKPSLLKLKPQVQPSLKRKREYDALTPPVSPDTDNDDCNVASDCEASPSLAPRKRRQTAYVFLEPVSVASFQSVMEHDTDEDEDDDDDDVIEYQRLRTMTTSVVEFGITAAS